MGQKFKGLIFDLDGVIVNTAKYHFLAWKQIADELNIVFTERDNERLKGVSRVESFEKILEIGSKILNGKDKEYYCRKKNNIYVNYINSLDENEILPGAKEFLIDSREKGYLLAIGSASKNALRILEQLNIINLFDAIIDGTKVTKAKPDPEVFVKGAQALGVAPDRCIVFEDSFAGIEAAQNAGMTGIGIGDRENLPKAVFCLSGFEKITIEELIKRLE